MKNTMKKYLAMLAWLAGVCVVYAADFWWPLGTDGNGLTGDLSSTGATGWNNVAIDFSVANRWVLGQPGSYTVQLYGKKMSMAGEIKMVNQPNKAASHVTLDIDQGASLTAAKLTMGSSNDRWDSSMRVRVAGGSSLTMKDLFLFSYGNATFDVLSGSTLTSEGALNLFNGGWQDTLVVTSRMTVVDSSWTAKGNVQLGGDYNHCVNWEENSWTLTATNSSLNFAANVYVFKPVAKVVLKDSTTALGGELRVSEGAKVVLDGGFVTGGTWNVGYYGSDKSQVEIFGGTHVPNTLKIASGAGASAEVLVDGADAVLELDPANLYIADGGEGSLHVRGGRACLAEGKGGWIRLPRKTGSSEPTGKIIVDGGEIDLTSATTTPLVWAGENGAAYIEVNGGRLAAHSIRFQNSGSSAHVLKQTGGLIDMVARVSDQGYILLSGGTKECRLELMGGVLACNQIKTADNNPNAKIVADGGTLQVNATPANPFMQNVGAVTCGPNGLGFDTGTYSVNLPQNITNASGEQGRFVKKGYGTLNLSSDSYDVAETAVAAGTLCLTRETPSFNTTLVVTNGATFSLVGTATGVTLDALVVTNGVLALDPGDVITVEGAVEIKDLSLSFSSLPNEPKDFLVVNGELSESAAASLRRAYYAAAMSAGKHAKLTTTYDSVTGKTTIRFEAASDASPLTDSATWTGAGDGTWGAAANWQGGLLPTAEKKAVFGETSAQKTVTVTEAAVAGALSFAGNYTLEGPEAVEIAADQGAARIDVTAGATEIAAPLTLDAVTYATLAAGSALTLSGTVVEGGFKKSGQGRLNLALDSLSCPYGLSFGGGTTSVATEESFGARMGALNRVEMTSDTLEVDSSSGEELVFGQAVTLSATNATAALVLKSETPATFKNLTVASGAIIKRGASKLTLEVKDGDVLTYGNGALDKSVLDNVMPLSFEADGVAPSSYYAGLTVAEGELCIKSADPDAVPHVTAKNCIVVGQQLFQGVSNPTLTVDHVYFDANSGDSINLTYIGYKVQDNSCVMREPTLRIVNGATYYCYATEMGTHSYNSNLATRPTIIVEDSTLKAQDNIGLGMNTGNGNIATVRGKNASFEANRLRISGLSQADFDNCTVGAPNNGYIKLDNPSYTPTGHLRFVNGSVLRLGSFEFNALGEFQMVFDASMWDFGTGDFVLGDACFKDACRPVADKFSLKMEGVGLIVAPADGKKLTLDVPVVGEGGFVNRGPGTVAFASGRYGFTGKLVAEAGAIDLSAAGTIENATIGAGAGVISGGTFHNATIALDSLGGAVPTFANCTFTGTTRVTVGGEPAQAEGVTVANYTGTMTGVNTFRLKGWKGYRGIFTAKDGLVTAEIGQVGMVLVIR